MFDQDGIVVWQIEVDGWIQRDILVYISRTGIQEAVGVYVCRVWMRGFST
jgi:hypothetical protein